jgi:transposase
MAGGRVARAHSPGAPRRLPDALVGDKGYSYDSIRTWCRKHGVQPIIPTRSDQPRQRTFRRAAYRKRCRVECLFNRLKQYRRVATRYERRAANYLAMVHIASIHLWL